MLYQQEVRHAIKAECRYCGGTGATSSDVKAKVFEPCPACKGAGVHLIQAEASIGTDWNAWNGIGPMGPFGEAR